MAVSSCSARQLARELMNDRKVAWQLMNDDSFASDNQRAKEFHRLTGSSERKFYRLREELKDRMDDRGDADAGSCQGVELLGSRQAQ
jgi:hypothetical protein